MAPTFARPDQVARNSGRFSISSATTSPWPMPWSAAQWATRFAAAFQSRVGPALGLEQDRGLAAALAARAPRAGRRRCRGCGDGAARASGRGPSPCGARRAARSSMAGRLACGHGALLRSASRSRARRARAPRRGARLPAGVALRLGGPLRRRLGRPRRGRPRHLAHRHRQRRAGAELPPRAGHGLGDRDPRGARAGPPRGGDRHRLHRALRPRPEAAALARRRALRGASCARCSAARRCASTAAWCACCTRRASRRRGRSRRRSSWPPTGRRGSRWRASTATA